MPSRSGPFIIQPTEGGETKIVIALELTINLNPNGLSASITTMPKQEESEDQNCDFSGFEIPEFLPSSKIQFGKKVKGELDES